jgi:hypothetical protein
MKVFADFIIYNFYFNQLRNEQKASLGSFSFGHFFDAYSRRIQSAMFSLVPSFNISAAEFSASWQLLCRVSIL